MENKGSLLRCIPAMMLVIAGHFYWRRLSTVFPTISSCQFECCIANYSFFKIYLIGAAAVVSHRFLLVFTIIFFLLVFFLFFATDICFFFFLFFFLLSYIVNVVMVVTVVIVAVVVMVIVILCFSSFRLHRITFYWWYE